MSLDVNLTGDPKEAKCTCCNCGNEHIVLQTEEYYSANITHNLGAMAKEADLYYHLWEPNEIGITKASQLILPLQIGLALMKLDPERFKKFDAKNGWGTYRDFVPWIERYLEACIELPNANVSVSR